MTEQEVQWGEWINADAVGVVKRYGHDFHSRYTEFADAAYLNALEREVRDLRAYKVLAERMAKAASGHTPLSVRGWRALLAEHDALTGKHPESATAGKE